MSELGRCITCQHWYPVQYERMPQGWGNCERFYRETPDKTPPAGVSAVLDWSPIDEGASLYAAPDFGCVMHVPREDAE